MTNVMKPLLYVYFNCKSIREENSHNNRQFFFSLDIVFLLNPLEKFLEFEVTTSLSLSLRFSKKRRKQRSTTKKREGTRLYSSILTKFRRRRVPSRWRSLRSLPCVLHTRSKVCARTRHACVRSRWRVCGVAMKCSRTGCRGRARVCVARPRCLGLRGPRFVDFF